MIRRLATSVVMAFAVCAVLAGPVAGAKTGGGAVDVTKTVNLPIPDRPPGASSLIAPLTSTIEVGKQFKGRRIRDVNVTVQTLGTSAYVSTRPGPAADLLAILRAPNGAHTTLFSTLFGSSLGAGTFVPNPSIGPLTLDDETPIRLSVGNPVPTSRALFAPWAGTARPGGKPLAIMDNGGVRGTWSLVIMDSVTLETSNLVSWRLNVVAGRPFEEK